MILVLEQNIHMYILVCMYVYLWHVFVRTYFMHKYCMQICMYIHISLFDSDLSCHHVRRFLLQTLFSIKKKMSSKTQEILCRHYRRGVGDQRNSRRNNNDMKIYHSGTVESFPRKTENIHIYVRVSLCTIVYLWQCTFVPRLPFPGFTFCFPRVRTFHNSIACLQNK